jgi:epoxyqueuosine reductase
MAGSCRTSCGDWHRALTDNEVVRTTALQSSSIKARALAEGFDLCGIARADRYPKLSRLADWIDRGFAGDMYYLADSLDERLDPRRVLPTVRSVVSLGSVYNVPATRPSTDVAPGDAVIARYAWGDDYHEVLRHRMRRLLQWMADEAGSGFEAFSCVDNGPVQERVFAEQAGLGWIGKNSCLINPKLGSWIFLSEILTNAELEPDEPGVDQCGTCTRCLDACPTGAILGHGELDATRCLSYLTIETRGAVEESLRHDIGAHVFGCDICQDVCPWNRRAAESADPAWQPRPGLDSPRLIDLCRFSDEAWRGLMRGSAMRRAGLRRIRRSLAYAVAHLSGSNRHDALAALSTHPSASDVDVTDAIDWARRQS